MGGDEMLDFEESNYDDLLEKFKEKYLDKWEEFVYEQYIDYYADMGDFVRRDRREEE